MMPLGTPITGSEQVVEAWGIVRSGDRSDAALEKIRQLKEAAPTKEDRRKIGDAVCSFMASLGGRERSG